MKMMKNWRLTCAGRITSCTPKWLKSCSSCDPVFFLCYKNSTSTFSVMNVSRRSSTSRSSIKSRPKLPNLTHTWTSIAMCILTKTVFLTSSSPVSYLWDVSSSSKRSSESQSTHFSPSTKKSPKKPSLNKSTARPQCVSRNMSRQSSKSRRKARGSSNQTDRTSKSLTKWFRNR